MNLACRTSAFRYCALLQKKVKASRINVQVYKRFLECSRVFSFIIGQLEHGNLDSNHPVRSVCPACETNPDGQVFIAGDGNMSFQGKYKPCGISPLYKELWVHADLDKTELKNDKLYSNGCGNCSDFRADPNGMTTLRKESNLHHKGLFGTICKHRIPGYFIFMTHGGEAYLYCYKMIEHEIQKPSTRKLNVKYDIGCNYKRYLKVTIEGSLIEFV